MAGTSLARIWICASLAIVGLVRASPPSLAIEGNDYLSTGKIEELLVLPQHPEQYSPASWQAWSEDAAAVVEEYYHDIGFFLAAAVVTTAVDSTRDSSVISLVRLRIREGIRFHFREVAIEVGTAPMLTLAANLNCRAGKPFDRDLVYKDRRDILRTYGNAGFLHAKAGESWRLDTANYKVDLIYQVEAGRPLVFDTLLIHNRREGDSTEAQGLTQFELLRGLLNLKRGDTVSLRKTSAYERKLRSTHVFNVVRLKDSVLDTNSGLTAMVLKTEERVPGEMELAAFYETQFGPGFSGSWTHSNVTGRLHELHGLASLALKRQTLFLGYASLLLMGSPFRFDNDLSLDWQQAGIYSQESPAFNGDFNVDNQSRLSRGFGTHFRYVAAAELRGRSELADKAAGRLRDFNLNWLNSIFTTYLDDMLNPTRGVRFGMTWGNGGPILSSGEVNVVQERHNWLEAELAGYWPLWSWLNVAGRLGGGRFFGRADLNAERFFLGGARNVRSHDWREVCPEADSLGACVKVRLEPIYTLLSAEIRLSPFPVRWALRDNWLSQLPDIQIVPFLDYGTIWEVGEPVQFQGRGRAIGLGLRYVLFKIFNLRLDYAIDPYRYESDGSRMSRWVIDLAQAF